MLASATLVVLEPIEMTLVFDLSTPLPGPHVRGDGVVAIEHAHETSEAARISGLRTSVCGIE
jgi:hypothetical protein